MDTFFKSRNIGEATSQIYERLNMITDERLKVSVLSSIIQYSKKRPSLKKYPCMLKCHETKPSFHLGDGDLLFMYAAKIKSGSNHAEFTPVKYGGSADSVFMHIGEQLSSGQYAPAGNVGVFIVEYASSGTRSWGVEVWVGSLNKIDGVNVDSISHTERLVGS